jgi:hypothetical protein
MTPSRKDHPIASPAWYNQRGRIYWYDQYAGNVHEVAFSRYDPDRIAAEMIATGADVVAVYAANQQGMAYFPSKVWPEHPNLKGRDYVGDLCTRLHAAGKRVLLYINWLDTQHPEWWGHYLGKEIKSDDLWQEPCCNSPQREKVLAITREICERYRPDAFHLDMFFTNGICTCDYCRPHLERICGTTEITREAVHAHWAEYIDWRTERSASYLAEVTAILHEYGVIAAHNAFAPLYQMAACGVDEGWLDSLDVYVSECFDAFQVGDLNGASINVRWQHAVGKPAWILRTSTSMVYLHWPLTEAQWAVYVAACKANGAKFFGPCGVGARPDTTSSPKLLGRVTKAFDRFMEDADLDPGAKSAARIALVFSWATRRYFEAETNRWFEEFYGWARLLIEEHLPYDVIVAENVGREGVAALTGKYDLVILPDASHLSEAFCGAVREFVRAGGCLLATGSSSLGDEKGARLGDFQLGDVLGVHSEEAFQGCLAVEAPEEPEPASGTFQFVTATGEDEGELVRHWVDVDPVARGHQEDPLPLAPMPWPSEVRGTFGQGRSLYVAFDIGRYYQLRGPQHIAAWMRAAVDGLIGARQIVVKAPRTVEVTLWRQESPERTIVHLANRTVPWTLPTRMREYVEIVPVHDVEIEFALGEEWAERYGIPKVSCRGAELRMVRRRPILKVRVPVLEDYAAVVLEPGEARVKPARGR